MKNYLLQRKNESEKDYPVFLVEQDKYGIWAWMQQDSGTALKEKVLMGVISETKRGWTITNYRWTAKEIKIFLDRGMYKIVDIL